MTWLSTFHMIYCRMLSACAPHAFLYLRPYSDDLTFTAWEFVRNRLHLLCMLMLLFVCSRLPREATRISSKTKRALTSPKINHACYRISAFCTTPIPGLKSLSRLSSHLFAETCSVWSICINRETQKDSKEEIASCKHNGLSCEFSW